MNTAPLQNPAALLQNPPPQAKQNNASAAPTPFKQVLSQEVKQRREGANAADGAERPAAAKPAQAAGNTGTGTEAEAKATTDSSDGGAVVESATSDNPAMAAVSAELLALVAGLQHGADAAKPADTAAALAADTALGNGKAAGNDAMARLAAGPALLPAQDTALAASGDKVELPAGAAGSAVATAKDAALAQESRFGAALEQATAAKPAVDAALLKNVEQPETSLPPAIAQIAAVASAAQAPGTPAADKLTPQVGTPAWDAALGQKVVWMAAGGQQSASLTLNPPDLGPLQVVLHVSNSHANATFISAQPEVRQALEAAMPRLREMLGDAGIQLGQANVGSGMPNQQQASGESASRSASRDGTPATVGRDAALPPVRAERLSSGRGMVDTFA
jgi:flagellar hook-length control protein FliK